MLSFSLVQHSPNNILGLCATLWDIGEKLHREQPGRNGFPEAWETFHSQSCLQAVIS